MNTAYATFIAKQAKQQFAMCQSIFQRSMLILSDAIFIAVNVATRIALRPDCLRHPAFTAFIKA
jgi:hypothetical protein